MSRLKKEFIFLLLFMFGMFLIPNGVHAEAIYECKYDDPNELASQIFSSVTYSSTTNKVTFIYNSKNKSSDHILGSSYSAIDPRTLTKQGKCPKYLIIAIKNKTFGDWHLLFFDDDQSMSAGKEKLKTKWKNDFDVMTTLYSEENIADTEKENVESGNTQKTLERLKKDIDEKLNEFEEKGCNNKDIYNKNSSSYDSDLKSECNTLSQSISGLNANLKTAYDSAINGGMDESSISEYKQTIDNATDAKETVENSSDKSNISGAPTDEDNRIDLGAKYECEDLRQSEVYKWLKDIFFIIQIIVPILLLALGSVDFIKAIAAQKDDDMKKAQSTFVKRLIIAVIIFLMPAVLELIFSFLGTLGIDTCGIGSEVTETQEN